MRLRMQTRAVHITCSRGLRVLATRNLQHIRSKPICGVDLQSIALHPCINTMSKLITFYYRSLKDKIQQKPITVFNYLMAASLFTFVVGNYKSQKKDIDDVLLGQQDAIELLRSQGYDVDEKSWLKSKK